MKLVIVESPTKAKTLGKFLPKEYEVVASMGHIRDLPKSKLGVDTDKDFEITYEMPEAKEATVKKIRNTAKKAHEIILATDPDREGEAIAFHIAYLLTHKDDEKNSKFEIRNSKFKRVTFHEITKTAIEEALKNPGEVNLHLVDAQQARRVVDRLVGYSLSPVLWKKVRRGLSAGRVQSVALRMIVEREKEIEAFKPQEYWEIRVLVFGEKKQDFWIELFEIEGKKVEIKSKIQNPKSKENSNTKNQNSNFFLDSKVTVDSIEKDLKKAKYSVESVEKKERKRSPYPPYTTSTLQQAAANVLGWSGKQTMRVAQELYEKGVITYHRTDSFNLNAEAVNLARKVIASDFGDKYLPEKPQFYRTNSKNAQEAHEAIRPTDVTKKVVAGEHDLTDKHQKLYKLIWRRMVACQMLPSIYDQTTIVVKTDSDKYRLRAAGSVVKFDGWRAAYGGNSKLQNLNDKQISNNKIQTSNKTQSIEETVLPEVVEGEGLDYKDLHSEQKFTQPPPRYNDASLVKELEKKGIGRPSTYAPIISRIIDVGYVERVERTFKPTTVGVVVAEFLKTNFETVLDYNFTAEMEEDLDRIARGEKKWKKVMKSFYNPFEKQVVHVTKEAKRVPIPVEKTGEKCPECKEGDLVIRTGRFGKFISCSRFPECKYTAKLIQKLEGFKCPEDGGEVVWKRTKKGRGFWGCSNYPKCTYASWKDPRKPDSKAKNKAAKV